MKSGKYKGGAELGEKVGEDFAGFAEEAMVKDAEVGGRLGTNVIGSGVAGSVGGKAGGGLDGAGSADGEEDGGVVESGEDFVEMKRSFAEPADVRADLSAAFVATGNRGGLFVESRIVERWARTRVTAGFEEFAVHMDDMGRAGLFVEIVDILCAEEQAIWKLMLECGDRVVCRIGLGVRGDPAAHGVEIPNELRIAAPGVRRSDFFETVVAPEAIGIAKGRDATFSGDACAGEKEEAVGGGKGEGGHCVMLRC